MSPENFTYWLKGFFELTDSKTLTEEQVKIIKDHLKLALTKVTPEYHSDLGSIPYVKTEQQYKPSDPFCRINSGDRLC